LQQELHEVEPGSTFRNACCSKNVARLDDCDVCYTLQFFVMFVNLAIATQVAGQVAVRGDNRERENPAKSIIVFYGD
jgi:hypothetical protein